MIHSKVIDTTVLYPHKFGSPYKRSLKELAKQHLKKFIQQIDENKLGHDSFEGKIEWYLDILSDGSINYYNSFVSSVWYLDALAAMDLAKLKISKGIHYIYLRSQNHAIILITSLIC